MSDREESTPFSAHVCFFRHSALIHLPQAWRVPLVYIGEALTDLALDVFGQAPEAADGLGVTRVLLLGIVADLRTAADQLRELELSMEESEMSAEEVRLRRFVGRKMPQLQRIAEILEHGVYAEPDGARGEAP